MGAGMQQTATAWLALDAGAFAVGLVLAAAATLLVRAPGYRVLCRKAACRPNF